LRIANFEDNVGGGGGGGGAGAAAAATAAGGHAPGAPSEARAARDCSVFHVGEWLAASVVCSSV